jgi:ATP-dependent Lhr-like helicase
VLTARPYAYLDDAPLEERRTQAVMSRRWLDPASADEIGRLDEAAVARVREEAWPDAASLDELHDALVWLGFLTEAEADAREDWKGWLVGLQQSRRATLMTAQAGVFWVPAERLRQFRPRTPTCLDPAIHAPAVPTWLQVGCCYGRARARAAEAGADAYNCGYSAFPDLCCLTALEMEGFALADPSRRVGANANGASGGY